MKKFSILLYILVLALQLNAEQTPQNKLSKIGKQFFIENKGQWHPDILYLTRMGGLDVWITRYGVNYNFYTIKSNESETKKPRLDKFDDLNHENDTIIGHRVLLSYQGHNVALQTEGKQKQEGYYNYLIGNDLSKQASHVSLYKEAIVKNIYSGIDLRYYFDEGNLRYDYIVRPGADPSQIKLNLQGQYTDQIKQNELIFTTRFGEIKLSDIKTYQVDKIVTSTWQKQGNTYSIKLGAYDKTKTLIIDPLIYSTFIGGSNGDYSRNIDIDSSRNTYIIGRTNSTDYDITTGVYQTINAGDYDVFVSKLNANGTDLIYSTYLGGSNYDYGSDIAIDEYGNAYITGYTSSINFNITSGAYQIIHGGGYYDVFVSKLNANGTALIYSTYLGGNDDDYANSIAIDNTENVYVTGVTSSTNYDITLGAYQTTNDGVCDIFVSKININSTALIYSTYIGGYSYDYAYGIAIDNIGNAYITGYTGSVSYDITFGAYQTTHGSGTYDVFVTKLNANGTNLIYSTFIGGNQIDNAYSIAIDDTGNAYITGYTGSLDYDITLGAYQTIHGGYYDVFVSKLNVNGTALIYSTYIGGCYYDKSNDIAIDSLGNAYITGYTLSHDYDITLGAYQTIHHGIGTYDVFVTKLNANGTDLIYSTFTGGIGYDEAYSIAIDDSGNAYVTGNTGSNDYNITSGAYQTIYEGNNDIFVSKLDMCSTVSTITETACDSYTSPSGNYTWLNSGIYTDTIPNSAGCDSIIAFNLTIITVDASITNNLPTIIANATSATYQWIDCNTGQPINGATNQSFTATANGNYAVIVTQNGCTDTSACIILSNVGIMVPHFDGFKIYPNPSKNELFLEINNSKLITQSCEIIDINGKVLKELKIKNLELKIEISDLEKGTYFVKIGNETQRFVKE